MHGRVVVETAGICAGSDDGSNENGRRGRGALCWDSIGEEMGGRRSVP